MVLYIYINSIYTYLCITVFNTFNKINNERIYNCLSQTHMSACVQRVSCFRLEKNEKYFKQERFQFIILNFKRM